MSRLTSLVEQANRVFYSNPWYGDGVIEKLDKIPPEIVNLRPEGNIHTIAQLVAHIAVWKQYLIEKATGNDDYSIKEDSEVEWPAADGIAGWQDLITQLKSTHDNLIAVINSKDDDWLDIPVPGSEFNFGQMIQGVIQHDVYHVGQIGLIFKILKSNNA